MSGVEWDWKAAIGAVSVVIVLVAYIPYIRAIQAGRMKPHVLSWIIWSAVTITVFFAQLAGGGGSGAWSMGATGAIVLLVTLLAWLRRGEFVITRFDIVCLTLAAAALPVWAITNDPLGAVVILVVVDLLGFALTFRKAYLRPHEDSIMFFSLLAVRNITALAALEAYSLTTSLFLVTSMAACIGLAGLLGLRRMQWRQA